MMAEPPVPDEAVLHVARALESTRVPYAFMGGLALNAWGIPRATFDIDFVVATADEAFGPFLHNLRASDVEPDEPHLRGYRDQLAGMEKVTARLLAGDHWYRLDIFRSSTPFLESVIGRRARTRVRSTDVFVVSAADLVLFKLLAGRRKDWVDIDNVIAVQGVPEPDYLGKWAKQLGIEDRLTKVIGPPGPGRGQPPRPTG